MKIVYTETPATIRLDHSWDFSLLPEEAVPSVALYIPDEPLDSDTNKKFIADVEDADIIINNYVYYGPELLDKLKFCKIISQKSTGYNFADLDYAREKGIAIASIRDYCTQETAENAIASMLCLQRNTINFNSDIQEKHIWDYLAYPHMQRIEGQTMSIIGFGRIGQHVGRIAKGLGMRVLAFDPFLPPEVALAQGVELVDFDTALELGDVISVHMNLTAENRGMFNKDTFLKMKRHPIFINEGRGEMVDEEALDWALTEGVVRGAGLDMLESEDPDLENCVLLRGERRKNLIITPHSGFKSDTSDYLIRKYAIDNAINYFYGRYDEVYDIRNNCRA